MIESGLKPLAEIFNRRSIDRERPAAIPVKLKSMDDTSNFDEFPDVDLKWRKSTKASKSLLENSVKNLFPWISAIFMISVVGRRLKTRQIPL